MGMGGPCIHCLVPWDNFQKFEVSSGEAKQLPPFSSLLELRWVFSLFFWNRNSLLNFSFFFFSFKIRKSVVIDFVVVPVWGRVYLPCESEHFSVIPVTKGCIFLCLKERKFVEDREVLLQSYTDKHLHSFSQLTERSVCQAWLYAHIGCLSK